MADLKGNDKNCTLHGFQRNLYFYGKLMSVRDFQLEQSYLNEKRHLLNRFIHGSGIIRGFGKMELSNNGGVIEIEFKEGGVALDPCGNEIVVPAGGKKHQVQEGSGTLMASQLEKMGEDVYGVKNPFYYLYLKYNEYDHELVSSAENQSSCEEKCCYNRKKEDFVVIASTTAPDHETMDCSQVPVDQSSIGALKQSVKTLIGTLPGSKGGNVFLAAVKQISILQGDSKTEDLFADASETLKYRSVIFNNKLLSDLICCHISADNPHKELMGLEVDETQVKNKDGYITLEKIDAITLSADEANHKITIGENHSKNEIDPTSDDAERNKHVSNQDAKKWNGAILSINNVTPDNQGNFIIEPGSNVTITSAGNKITISAAGGGAQQPLTHTGSVQVKTNNDGIGNVIVDPKLGNKNYCVQVGIDHNEFAQFGVLQYAGFNLNIQIDVHRMGNNQNKFTIRINTPGLGVRTVPLRWWAIPGTPVSTPIVPPSTIIPPTVTPGPTITPTPGPVVTATPGPISTATPGPITTATPGPISTATPGPISTATPGPISTATPGPISTATPGPISTATPGPISTATPGPISTATPGPIATATPGPVATATPGPVATATPGPVATATPGPVATATPGPVATAIPGPVATATPGPVISTPPGLVTTATPGPVGPGPIATATPGPVTTIGPGPIGVASPAPIGDIPLVDVIGIGSVTAAKLTDAGINNATDLAGATPQRIKTILGFQDIGRARTLVNRAKELVRNR